MAVPPFLFASAGVGVGWWAWRRVADTRPWRITMLLVFLGQIASTVHAFGLIAAYATWSWWLFDLYSWGYWLGVLPGLLCWLAMVAAAFVDYRRGVPRDWTHWAPVGSVVAAGVGGLLLYAV